MTIYIYKNELYHWGTKGQKWGIRNYQNKDGSYTSKGQAENGGHGRYSNNDNQSSDSTKNQNGEKKYLKSNISDFLKNENTKKAIKIGVIVAASFAGAYALQYASANAILKSYDTPFAKFRFKQQFDLQKANIASLDDISKTTIFNNYFNEDHDVAVTKLLNRNNMFPDDFLDSMQEHPLIKDYYKNNGYDKELSYSRTNNCMLATTSLVMRLKGYYTQAAEVGLANKYGVGGSMVEEFFKNATIESPKKSTINGLVKKLAESGEGTYGNLMLTWKTGGGHSILYTVEKDGVHFIDGQLGKEWSAKELFSQAHIILTQFARLDNCDPTDLVLKCVENVGSGIIYT